MKALVYAISAQDIKAIELIHCKNQRFRKLQFLVSSYLIFMFDLWEKDGKESP